MCIKTTMQALGALCFMQILATVCLAQGQESSFSKQSPKTNKADSLYRNFNEQRALNAYKQLALHQPKDLKAAWRISFLYSRMGKRLEAEEQKKEYFNKALYWAKKSLDIDSTSSQTNFVMGVAMGRMALISGAKERVAAARQIKKYADLAIKYDSTNAGAWHLLGRWNFKVANLGWMERMAANTIFGGIPGDASNLKAADYIKKAIKLDDSLIIYHRDLARVYNKMGWKRKSISQCSKAITLPVQIPDDKSFKEDCRKLIKDLK